MTNLTPFLWFHRGVRDAVDRYLEVFDDAELLDSSPGPDGDYFVATLRVHDVRFSILSGGENYTLNEAFSFLVTVDTQDDVDRLWDALLDGGGKEIACGWLTDRFGVTWQIVPAGLVEMLTSSDREAAGHTQAAMMGMKKLDVAALRAAYDGR